MEHRAGIEWSAQTSYVARADFNALIDALLNHGYIVVGPTIRDGAIVFGEVQSDRDFPVGATDVQDGGKYRIGEHTAPTLFSFAASPHSLKTYLYPSRSLLYSAHGSSGNFAVDAPAPQTPARYAFIGVRSCDLHAMNLQDKVFLEGAYVDPGYKHRRENAFLIAVNCGKPAGTCFCVSMGTGPKAPPLFDLALTEICDDSGHYFVVECGSAQGSAILACVPHRPAEATELHAAQEVVRGAERAMGRKLDTTDIKELLYRNAESPRWEKVADRCLSCANCTMVCPTCFCSTVEDTTDLTGAHAERWRVWDSCFTIDFSHIHGGSVRKSGSSRYRHWITHKLASWQDQFGASGCVGCGRCVTWCPVGIDITEEIAILRQTETDHETLPEEQGNARD